ncbi:unnamed protein product [Discosporangium mesarthrocarpum]
MSNDPSQQIGRCKILRDACSGVMTRLAFLNEHALNPSGQGQGRPLCLRNPDYTRMKKKLEISFPEQQETAKVPGFDGHAQGILTELEGIFRTFEDVVEIRDGMVEELRDMSGCRTGVPLKFALDVNPELVVSFMSLMTDYVRLHLVVSRVEERKQALGMYFMAYSTVNRGKKPEPSYSRVNALMVVCDNPINRIYHELGHRQCETLRQCVGGALTEIKEVLTLYHKTPDLRSMSALNVLDEGDLMALPSQLPVSQRSSRVMLHSELPRCDQYGVWVCLLGLVMPGTVLGQSELVELWTTVVKEYLLVPIFRDMVLNLHAELEKMSAWFPPKGLTLALPEDQKFKKYVKQLSKDAYGQCILRHRERRAYLREELRNLLALARASPGMLGPKLPMVLSAVKMAKVEVLWYWQHVGQTGVKIWGKVPEHQQLSDPLISILIGALDALVSLVTQYASVVQRYYIEYLKGAHHSILGKRVEGAIAHTNIPNKLSKEEVARLSALPGLLDGLDPLQPEVVDLNAFRWDCCRLLGVLSDPAVNLLNDMQVAEMMRRMTIALAHSEYVDGLDDVLRVHGEMSDGWWYYDSVVKADALQCLEVEDSSSKYVTAYLKVLGSAINNVHEDCPDEQLVIGTRSADLAEELAEGIAHRVQGLVRDLVAQVQYLEESTMPEEAANRSQRQHVAVQQVKKHGGEAKVEPLPGVESEGWHHPTIRRQGSGRLSPLERNLTNLLTSLNAQNIVVFDRLIVPKEYVQEGLSSFFKEFVYTSTVFKDGEVVERPSVALRKLLSCSSVLHNAISRADIDVAAIIRKVLLDECTDWGHIHNKQNKQAMHQKGPPKERNVLDHISRWYKELLEMISPGGKAPGVVYVPAREGFVASSFAPKGGVPVDLFFDRAELRALCELLGSGGARAVEKAVLAFVASRVREIQVRWPVR